MSIAEPNAKLPPMRSRPAVALCLVGIWFSSDCNLAHALNQDGLARAAATYRAAYEDTLVEIARRFDLGYVELVAANPGIDPWLPGEGTEVILPTVHLSPDAKPDGIVINLGDMRLYYFEGPGQPPRSYPIGIGREGLLTPVGTTVIARKTKDPIWRPTARMRTEDPTLPEVVLAGPENPMGTRAMYLGWSQYAIHGTNKPAGIGRRSSSGCIRMYPEDAEALYDLIAVGTKVTVVDQPIKLGWINGEIFMDAHSTQAQSDQIETSGRFEPRLPSSIVDQVVAFAGQEAHRLDWSRIREAVMQRRGYPIRITR
jgi:L,D-transpeptidase ErfK/SrfK